MGVMGAIDIIVAGTLILLGTFIIFSFDVWMTGIVVKVCGWYYLGRILHSRNVAKRAATVAEYVSTDSFPLE